MTITAKFASTCPCCNKPIQPGQQVEWERGQKARHTDCSTADQAPAAKPATPGPRTITLTRDGRRTYIGGDTMAVRGLLRDGGCHWDADRKQWWVGDHAAAEALAASARTAQAEDAPKKRITRCCNDSCGAQLDEYTIRRGYRFCSKDCAIEAKHGSGYSGYVNGVWHQGSDD